MEVLEEAAEARDLQPDTLISVGGGSTHATTRGVAILSALPEQDLESLLQIRTSACMASLAGVGDLGLNTAIAHHVGGLYNVAHGEANAILLPHSMRFNLDASAERQALTAEYMGLKHYRHDPGGGGYSGVGRGIPARPATGLAIHAAGSGECQKKGLEFIASATLYDRLLATNPTLVSHAGPIMSL